MFTQQQFRSISLSVRKVELAKQIISLCGDSFSVEEIKEIVSLEWVQDERTTQVAQKDISVHLHSCPKEFAEAATLRHTGFEHSWAGDSIVQSWGLWIIGSGDFGFHKNLTYSNNGNCGSPIVENITTDFNIKNKQAILVRTLDEDNFNGRDTREESWDLHLYLGDGEYPFDPIVKEIIEKFGL